MHFDKYVSVLLVPALWIMLEEDQKKPKLEERNELKDNFCLCMEIAN